jgi:hypothetical protein
MCWNSRSVPGEVFISHLVLHECHRQRCSGSDPEVTPQCPRIDQPVHTKNNAPKDNLQPSCECRRIKQREEILFHKPDVLDSHSALGTQPVFERRERAKPAGKFHHNSPESQWDVYPNQPVPSNYQECSKDCKDDECKVNY